MSNQASPEDGKNKKELDKKSKLIIAGACGIAALVVIIIIVIAVNMNSKNKKSYKYNLKRVHSITIHRIMIMLLHILQKHIIQTTEKRMLI